MRLRLILEYDGTDFAGWQAQSCGRTVQGTVEGILARLLQRQVRITGSGRTDAGVHAAGQVAHLDLEERESERAVAGLRALLPPDVALLSAEEVPESFHARFSAVKRSYEYRISKGKHPLATRFSLVSPWPALDTGAMSLAAAESVGKADWRGMAREGGGNRSWLVEVKDASVVETGTGWTLHIEADRFLRGMVRLWAGTLVEAGRGRAPAGRIAEILRTGDRRLAGQSLPACGLTLVGVEYP
jgi:tRNA pseudouridine38-40 synthase